MGRNEFVFLGKYVIHIMTNATTNVICNKINKIIFLYVTATPSINCIAGFICCRATTAY